MHADFSSYVVSNECSAGQLVQFGVGFQVSGDLTQ